MRIVPQSVSVSHSYFPAQTLLMLAAPQIAGLLPARVPLAAPDPFIYVNPRLAELPDAQQERLFEAAQTLLDVAVGRALDELNDHALNTALALFRRAVTGRPMRPANPAQYNAEHDATLLEWLASTSRRGLGVHDD